MSDTLAAINVEQLSSAVNAVVQAAAVGPPGTPLDPSPPPSHAPMHGERSRMVASGIVTQGPQRNTLLTLPTEITIPLSTMQTAQLALPTSVQQSATIVPQQNAVVPTSTPLMFQVNMAAPSGISNQLITLPQIQQTAASNVPVQVQTSGREVLMLRQIGNNLVLVPSSSTSSGTSLSSLSGIAPSAVNQLPTVNLASLVQPARANNEITQAAGSLVPRNNQVGVSSATVCPPSTSSSTPGQQSSLINMNIAIHLPNGSSQRAMLTGVNQLSRSGLQTSQPISAQITQDHNNQVVTGVVPISQQSLTQLASSLPLQTNPTQFAILPNQTVLTPTISRPLTSQLTSQVNSVPQVTFITPKVNPSLVNVTNKRQFAATAAPSLVDSISGISVVSPLTGQNYASQSQKFVHTATAPVLNTSGISETPLQVRQIPASSWNVGKPPATLSVQQHLSGLLGESRASGLPSSGLTGGQGSDVMNFDLPTASLMLPSTNRSKAQTLGSEAGASEVWCVFCEALVTGTCPKHGMAVVISDNLVQTKARQSLPGLLALKPSAIVPSYYGVWAQQVIQHNTRFGPLIGELKNLDTNPTDAEPLVWRIYKNGKLQNYLQTQDEHASNWMMFVKLARYESEQNLVAYQSGSHIYFSSNKTILPGQELAVWYSKAYAHLRGVTERPEDSFKCSQCEMQFPRLTQLTRHVKYSHPDLQTRKWKCEFCPRAFTSATKLNTHILIHMGMKPHTCDICGKGFTDPSNLRAHLMIHSGLKRFCCKICNKMFRQKAHLTSHMIIHTGEKKLQCHICKKAFGRSSDLKYHVNQHTQTKRIRCNICSQTFWKESQLQRHMKIHTGQRDYPCPLCGKGFITQYHLNRHQKSCRAIRLRRKQSPYGVDTSANQAGPSQEQKPRRYRRRPSQSAPEESPACAPRERRSSRGRPIRPRILPYDAAASQSISRQNSKPRRRNKSPALPTFTCDNAIRGVTTTSSLSLYSQSSGRGIISQTSFPQVALGLRRDSPIGLDCDNFNTATADSHSQLGSGFPYGAGPSGSGLPDPNLTAPLFDLGETVSMSSNSQSIPPYNPSSFVLGENQNDAFSETQLHCRAQQPLFLTSPAISQPMDGRATQNDLHSNQSSPDSLSDDALFSVDPADEGSSSSSQSEEDQDEELDEVAVEDLQAIEEASALDDEEQCTDERRGDSPSEHIEE